MIEARLLSKSYRKRLVLNRVSFSVADGGILAVVGANGAGKTTLLKLLALVNRPTDGDVWVDGENATEAPGKFHKLIGYVPQANAFFQELTVQENIDYWKIKSTGPDVASLLGLDGVLRQKAASLSGGMQRRLNLALGIINDPSVLIMDEPLTGVDIMTRTQILAWIAGLKCRGMTVIYSTHHADEIEGTADGILVLREGAVALCTLLSAMDEPGGVSGIISKYI